MGQAQPAHAQDMEFHTDLPVGEVLRRARVHYGQSLKDVEKNLRIRSSQIEAIENGRHDALPGRVYAIGFVRSYAEYLGLDGDRIVHLFKTQSVGQGGRPELNFPVAASESKLPSIWVLLASLTATVFIITLWWAASSHVRESVTQVPAVPDALRAQIDSFGEKGEGVVAAQAQGSVDTFAEAENAEKEMEGDVPEAAPDAAPAHPSSVVMSGSANDMGDAPQADSQLQASQSSAAVAQNQNIAPAPDAPAANISSPVLSKNGITLNIKENSWVEIRDEDNKAIVSKVLKVGDQYFVPNRPDLTMSLGNAGGVEVIIDGKKLQPLGQRGEVLRDISLDADILRKRLENPVQ